MDLFESVPWCAALLLSPGITTFIPSPHSPAGPNGHSPSQDQLFVTTLNTANAVPRCVGFYQSPFSDAGETKLLEPVSRRIKFGQQLLISTASYFFELCPGVNGFNGTAHGGLIACLFDQAMGDLLFINGEIHRRAALPTGKRCRRAVTNGTHLPPCYLNPLDNPMFTASMETQLLKPLVTPQIVLVTVSLNKVAGRKIYLDSFLENEEGIKFAAGRGIWVSARKGKL
ncbi:hypothetical protein F4825DRAFT_462086 [Nemania diffusa]|nr:hypothetical protein F4825DRAFT_462086 [Nemania diffusa]